MTVILSHSSQADGKTVHNFFRKGVGVAALLGQKTFFSFRIVGGGV